MIDTTMIDSVAKVTEYLDSGVPFRSAVADKELRELLGNFRYDGHVISELTATETLVNVVCGEENQFRVEWQHWIDMYCAYTKVDGDEFIIHWTEKTSHAKVKDILRSMFGVYRAGLDHRRTLLLFNEKYPNAYIPF